MCLFAVWSTAVSFYERRILPHLINCACGAQMERDQRARVVPLARGTVLELGIGTGHNLPFYDPAQVTRVIGADPSAESWALAGARLAGVGFPVRHHAGPVETLDIPDASVDTVLVTWSLCTIPDPARTLAGVRRTLRQGGQLVFCEHGLAPDAGVARWQRRIEPLWKRIAGGCHLGRAIPDLIEAAGFAVNDLATGYLPGAPRIVGYHYWGTARPAGSA